MCLPLPWLDALPIGHIILVPNMNIAIGKPLENGGLMGFNGILMGY